MQNVYKNTSARVKLLSLIHKKVSPYVAESIYETMLRPLQLYCYTLQRALHQEAINKLQYVNNRTARIFNARAKTMSWDSIERIRKERVAVKVFKFLYNQLPEDI